jgi:acyl carrier protein
MNMKAVQIMSEFIFGDFNTLVAALATYVEEISLGEIESSTVTKDSKILTDLKFDSLDYASLMLMGEQFLDTKIVESNINWNEIVSIGDLANILLDSQRK